MVVLSICLVQVITSSANMALFLTAVIYMMVVNMCKFNKRTKVVICTLLATMCINIAASIVSFLNEIEKGRCMVYPLAYSLLS